MKELQRCTISHTPKSSYCQFFRFLMKEPFRRGLSSHAKVLYTLICERFSLSRRNHWANENQEVYVIFTREEIADLLGGVSLCTAAKVVGELCRFGLIEEEKCQGYANRIYLIAREELMGLKGEDRENLSESFSDEEEQPESCAKPRGSHTSSPIKNQGDPSKNYGTPPINFMPELNRIKNNNYIDPSIDPSRPEETMDWMEHTPYYQQKIQQINRALKACWENQDTAAPSPKTECFAQINRLYQHKQQLCRLEVDYSKLPLLEVEERIQEQIDYDALTGRKGACETDRELVDNIVAVMAETLRQKTVGSTVRERLLRLSSQQVEALVHSIKEYTKPIRNPKRFLERSIYNAAFSDGTWQVNQLALSC